MRPIRPAPKLYSAPRAAVVRLHQYGHDRSATEAAMRSSGFRDGAGGVEGRHTAARLRWCAVAVTGRASGHDDMPVESSARGVVVRWPWSRVVPVSCLGFSAGEFITGRLVV